jgi:hypothetical protein
MFPRAISAVSVPNLESPGDPLAAAPRRQRAPLRADGFREAARATPPAAIAPRPPPDPIALAGLAASVEEARLAALARGDGPAVPTDFERLRARLEAARDGLPPSYRRAVADPLLASLESLGARGLSRLLDRDPEREGAAGLLLDLAAAVLQRAEGYRARATAAFQEVVSDLYEGFLSAEDRRGVKPPDHGVVAPLVRWGSTQAGPYTWPATDTAVFGAKAALVSLPAANASAGLLAWPALAHETAGHDVLAADDGLQDELAGRVRAALVAAKLPAALADYWADRIGETASDVLGVLNMGPAAAVGLLGYFRALNGAWGGSPSLRNVGPEEDPHPADIVRAYLAAETVRLLSFEGAARWADRLVAEADRDLGRIRLGGRAVSAADARASAAAVARAIVSTPLKALEGRALGEIQDWRDADEAVVAELRRTLAGGPGAGRHVEGAYAAHAVAAGVYEAVGGGSRPGQVMDRMIDLLAAMHERNPTWRVPRKRRGSPGGLSVDVPPRLRPVERADADAAQELGVEQARVHAHAGIRRAPRPLPVRDAAAAGAADEPGPALAPEVAVGAPARAQDAHRPGPVVGPERAVAAADGAVARRERPGPAGQHDADGAAVTGAGEEHRGPGHGDLRAGVPSPASSRREKASPPAGMACDTIPQVLGPPATTPEHTVDAARHGRG